MFGRRKDASPPPPPATPAAAQFRIAPRSPSEVLKPTSAPPPPPPKPKRSRGGLLWTLSGLLTLALFVGLGVLVGVGFVSQAANAPGPLPADKVVLIPRNSGVNEIAALLQREGVIRQPLLFEAYTVLSGKRGLLKAGEYQFKASASVDDAVDVLASGRAILHSFSVPEGLTSEQIVARMMENDILTGEIKAPPEEGSLLPDTYKFERGMTRQQLIGSMQAAQKQALNQIWARRAADIPVKSPRDLVTLASIVEKETGRADERTRVAGVFINRLNKNMRLQSDPTIVYGLVGGKGTLGRGILRSEIDRPTPYNTYTINGLPPGPIANPGRAAMEAVANPSRTRDLYFVADGTGGHAFAETYEQHQRNVARWRQIERGRDAAGQAAPAQVDRAEPPPAETRGDVPAASAFAATPPPVTGALPGVGAARAVDAVAGTPRDPLLNTTFDLNSPKTVPAIEEPAPAAPAARPRAQRPPPPKQTEKPKPQPRQRESRQEKPAPAAVE